MAAPRRRWWSPGGQPPALTITKEQLGPWLWRYTTGAGSYDSIIVEFDDYIMMLEAGQSQARAQLYIDEIKRQFPGKPIRYVWNSHPHGDHTPGHTRGRGRGCDGDRAGERASSSSSVR